MSHRLRARRGVSEAVSAVISLAIIAMLFMFLVTQTPPPVPLGLTPSTMMLNSLVKNRVLIAPSQGGVVIINNGPRDIAVEFVIYKNLSSNTIELSDVGRGNVCDISDYRIASGDNVTVVCEPGVLFIGFVSASGITYTIDPRFYNVQPVSPIINQTVLLSSEVISNLALYIEDPQLLWEGAVLTWGELVYPPDGLTPQGQDIPVDLIDLKLHVSFLIIGRNADNTSWNLLAIGHMRRNDNIIINIINSLSIDGKDYLGQRFRLKIENLTADTITLNGDSLKPGIYPCSLLDGQCVLKISGGTADTFRLYIWGDSSKSTTVGFDPYTVSADVDGNGYQELFLVTQDFSVGDVSEINDRNPVNSVPAIDKTIRPLRIIFINTPINNSLYSTAVVSLRMRYWDNSLDYNDNDIEENNNLPIITVGLYDIEKRGYIYSTELSYYDLVRYKGSPFSASEIVKDFLLRIPPPQLTGGSKVYYVGIDISDPYWLTESSGEYLNDADIVTSIEYVGLILGGRT